MIWRMRNPYKREPRHRYSTAAEMAWELEHPELVSAGERERQPAMRGKSFLYSPKMLLYAGLVLVPVLLFVVMLVLAKR